MKYKNSRIISAKIIALWIKNGAFPDRLIPSDLPIEDRPFIVELVYGAIKQKKLLQWIAEYLSPRKPDKYALPFLMIGLYQIYFMNVPDYAAINETVEASKKTPAVSKSGYINGLLRRAAINKKNILNKISKHPLSIRLSHPDVLISKWVNNYGYENTVKLCKYNNNPAHCIIRPISSVKPYKDILNTIKNSGISCSPCGLIENNFIKIEHGYKISDIPGFHEGYFIAQDPATDVAVNFLELSEELTILDACAAPGGKTIAIYDKTNQTGYITALDSSSDRVNIIKENLSRLNINSINVFQADSTSNADIMRFAPKNGFDRILLDVPCSNTGVLQRRPDARWRFNSDTLADLNNIQLSLLNNVSSFLKKNGVLVYSTCSIEPEENNLLIKRWLAENKNFNILEDKLIFPTDNNTDGAYAAKIIRIC